MECCYPKAAVMRISAFNYVSTSGTKSDADLDDAAGREGVEEAAAVVHHQVHQLGGAGAEQAWMGVYMYVGMCGLAFVRVGDGVCVWRWGGGVGH